MKIMSSSWFISAAISAFLFANVAGAAPKVKEKSSTSVDQTKTSPTPPGTMVVPTGPTSPAPAVVAPSVPTSDVTPVVVETPTAAPTVVETVAAPSQGKITGAVELRPTWTTQSGAWGTENNVELGYSFNPTRYLGYHQDINTNLHNPKEDTSKDGLHATAADGFVRGRLDNLIVNKELGLAMGYEGRLYLPTDKSFADAGGILKYRNYVKVAKSLGGGSFLTLMDLPIIHVYDRPGAFVDGKLSANPTLENRVYLILDVAMLDGKLSFSLPLMLNSTKYRNVDPGAKNNNITGHKLWIYPELSYAITPNVAAGVAFYSDNLVSPDLHYWKIKEGLEAGAAQLVLRASL